MLNAGEWLFIAGGKTAALTAGSGKPSRRPPVLPSPWHHTQSASLFMWPFSRFFELSRFWLLPLTGLAVSVLSVQTVRDLVCIRVVEAARFHGL